MLCGFQSCRLYILRQDLSEFSLNLCKFIVNIDIDYIVINLDLLAMVKKCDLHATGTLPMHTLEIVTYPVLLASNESMQLIKHKYVISTKYSVLYCIFITRLLVNVLLIVKNK